MGEHGERGGGGVSEDVRDGWEVEAGDVGIAVDR